MLAIKAARVWEWYKQAVNRGEERRAVMLLNLHRSYTAAGLAAHHAAFGSNETAAQLLNYARDMREKARMA